MKKEILEEINRFRELLSLKPMNIINEAFVTAAFLKKIGLEAIEQEIEAFIKKEAKELAIQEVKKGVPVTSLRGGVQAGKQVEKQSVDKVFAQIEKKSGRTLTSAEKLKIEQEIRLSLVEEMKLVANEFAKVGMKVGKQETKKSTWRAIKEHIKRNKGKYGLAAGALALGVYAYFYPGEKPEEDDDEEKEKPQRIKYRYCPDFPFTKSCKNEKIREIQKCIGTVPDGFYGPKTEQKLIENGYPTKITKEVFNNIMAKCQKTQEPKPDESGLPPEYANWSSEEPESGENLNLSDTPNDEPEG
jgi:hypothetical protein